MFGAYINNEKEKENREAHEFDLRITRSHFLSQLKPNSAIKATIKADPKLNPSLCHNEIEDPLFI